jgi:hypothetical protein
MMIDRRLLPAEKVEDAFAELQQILGNGRRAGRVLTLEQLTGTNGFRAAADGPGDRAGRRHPGAPSPAALLNATGVSDGCYFADDGIEIVNFWPGSGPTVMPPTRRAA